jgi:hypothetical protein
MLRKLHIEFWKYGVLACDAVTGQVIGDVSKNHNAFTYRVNQSEKCKHMTIQNMFMEHSPEKLTLPQLVKKFPTFYGTRRFITAFTSARHLSLYWASSIQSIPPHLTSWWTILILPSHLLPVLQSGLFPSGLRTKTLYAPLLSPIRATCPAHLILLDFITRAISGKEFRSFSSYM